MKIGIFGGAFNPVHNGHLKLADAYLTELKLDKIIFIPTAVPPHKTSEGLISGEHRINMLKSAITKNESFEVSDIEFKRTGKSYSYDTICRLKKVYTNDELYLIIGSDQFFSFHNWYRALDILNMVTVCTAAREENEYNMLCNYKNSHEDMKNCILSNFDVFEVSSTDIRNRIKNGESISPFVPKEVEQYIKENNLYV